MRDKASVAAPSEVVQLVFPVVANPKPKALVVHCADVRFRKAFRNFLEGAVPTGCLGLKEEDYVSLVIPGGVSSLSEALTLPKQFKVAREQIDFLLGHFPSIDQVVLINHEDCAAYKLLTERVGAAYLRRFTSMLERQHVDLVNVAKVVMGLEQFKATIKVYMAKFANLEHTQVTFEEVKL